MTKNKYTNLSKEELIQIINKLKQNKKYGLVWEDRLIKEEIVVKSQENISILNEKKDKSIFINNESSTHMLIEGDNFHSLTTLNYTHKKKIDFIYIDPPYNTGANDWRYNNDYVEKEDNFRHSKWADFMHKRILLSKNLLKDDGVLCCAIDDYEIFTLLGIFKNLEASILGIVCIVNKKEGRNQKKYFTGGFEYAVFVTWGNPKIRGLLIDNNEECDTCGEKLNDKKIHGTDKKGDFEWIGYHRRNPIENPEQQNRWYPIYLNKQGQISIYKSKDTVEIYPINSKGIKKIWGWDKFRFEEYITEYPDGYKVEKNNENYKILIKRYSTERKKPKSFWIGSRYNSYAHGTKLLKEVLNNSETMFDFPKSIHAVSDCIDLFLPEDGIVLDYFAGSGTTGHAVLELNNKDEGNRQFILCTNNENKICEEVTYNRISNVITGYGSTKGINANLKYYKATFIDSNHILSINDKDKTELAQKAGCLLSLAENTLDEVEHTSHFQFFKSNDRNTAIYFQEDLSELDAFVNRVEKLENPTTVYLFSWGNKSEFESMFDHILNINIKTIPQPILEIYKKIYYINN